MDASKFSNALANISKMPVLAAGVLEDEAAILALNERLKLMKQNEATLSECSHSNADGLCAYSGAQSPRFLLW
jgi:hypothetical protein